MADDFKFEFDSMCGSGGSMPQRFVFRVCSNCKCLHRHTNSNKDSNLCRYCDRLLGTALVDIPKEPECKSCFEKDKRIRDLGNAVDRIVRDRDYLKCELEKVSK